MSFISLSYFLFLPVVFLIHCAAPDKLRWLVLLAASFCFYAALKAPHLIAVLLFITTITYFIGILIERKVDIRTKQLLLWSGVTVNVLSLFILKYLSFLIVNLNIVLNRITQGITVPANEISTAIGASYFIFQAISYLIDIYLEIEKPEHHFGRFALYMSFFPKLLQGPIERGGDLLSQFRIPYVFNYDNVRSGMLLFSLGLLKKVVIADRLAVMINPVFDNVHSYEGFNLLLTTYYYSLQIYFDFSGYTDMALGTALIFNVKLTQNFNNPYFATSIADFWRRWHISFSRWILDYIFKPLQMSWRNWGSYGTSLALLVSFTISGVWHGACWGFVIWGVLHGLYMAVSIPFRDMRKRLLHALNISSKSRILKLAEMFITFNLVSLAWIFFRAGSIGDAFYIIDNCLFAARGVVSGDIFAGLSASKLSLSLGKDSYEVWIAFVYIVIITLVNNTKYFARIQFASNAFTRWAYYIFIITSIMLLGFFGRNEFIYVNF